MRNKSFSFNIGSRFCYSESENKSYELSLLKKMEARRMTPITKIAVDFALQCHKDNTLDFLVYSSRHGELNLSYQIIQSIIAGEIPSPIKFSQSTHNASVGLFSILAKEKIPMTAISAGENSLSMGLINALSAMHAKKYSKVLLLFADAKVPIIYENKIAEKSEDNVLAMVLEEGDDYILEIGKHFLVNEFSAMKTWVKNPGQQILLNTCSVSRRQC